MTDEIELRRTSPSRSSRNNAFPPLENRRVERNKLPDSVETMTNESCRFFK